jgi:hypothetical protein
LCLRQVTLFEPFNGDMVVSPAVVGGDVILVLYLPELFDKPLFLKLFTFEDDPWS